MIAPELVNVEVPEGWFISPLKEIAAVNPRHPTDIDQSLSVTFVPMAGLSESRPDFQFTESRPLADVRKAFTHFAEGDVLFAKITPCMENGKAAIARRLTNGLGCGTTELHVLRPSAAVLADYLYHFLHQERIRSDAAANFSGSAGQQRVPVSFVSDLPIPLPPLVEQERIVAQIEALLARVQATKVRLERAPQILKRFRRAVLTAACNGRLTAEWRVGRDASSDWKTMRIGDMCRIIGGSQPAKSHFVYEPRDGYVRFIQIRDYKSDSHLTFIPRAMARRFCSASDVMIGRYGPPLFQILRGIDGAYNVALMKAVPIDLSQLSNDYLFIMLQYPPLRSDVIQFSERTVGQDGVRKDLLEDYEMGLPNLEEQHEIVRRVDSLFKLADAIERRVTIAAARADKLVQAILAKAFCGELVPTEADLATADGRDYESAEKLLGRVRLSQVSVNGAPAKSRTRRRVPS